MNRCDVQEERGIWMVGREESQKTHLFLVLTIYQTVVLLMELKMNSYGGKGIMSSILLHVLINFSIQGTVTQMIQVSVLKNTHAFVSC